MNLDQLQKEVFDRTKKIIEKNGPRLAGSKACLDTADDLYEELKSFSDDTKKEDFFVYQGAFLGWIRILVFSFLVGIIFLWLNYPLISLIVSITSLLILILQFFLYLPLLDKLYPKKKATNVYGILEPKDEVKRQVIISGHHDSAHVFNFFIHQPKLYNLRTTGSIFFVILLILLSTLLVFVKDIPVLTLSINILLSLSFLLVGQMWFFSSKKVAPGAGDNMIASSIALTIGKYFKSLNQQDKGLKHTRLILMSFDAEEEGLRGARAYAKKHKEFLNKTKTYMLNMDCLYDEKELFFLTSDLNDFVKLDENLANDLKNVASMLNIETKTQRLAFLTGGTDAAELAKVGVSATTIIGMPWSNSKRSNVYHTPNDILDNVSPKATKDTLEIFIKYITNLDRT
jgi:aminopeptidase YwaD